MASFLFLWVTLAALGSVFASVTYQNSPDGPLNFYCTGAHQSFYALVSTYSYFSSDRLYHFYCRNLTEASSSISTKIGTLPEKCNWTNYVNDFDKVLVFQCPKNGYIAGVYSIHQNHYEDRKFRFLCCETTGLHTEDCSYSGPVNKYRANIRYIVPKGQVIRGAVSTHLDDFEDRVWDFEICYLQEHWDETTFLGK